jgi:hypothetical protein
MKFQLETRHFVYASIIAVVAIGLILGLAMASAPRPSVELERNLPTTIRSGPGRDDVVRYRSPDTSNLAGFKKVHEKVDNIARERTRQANDYLSQSRDAVP